MRIPSPLLRSGPTVAAAVALSLAPAAGSVSAGPGISVSTSGSTVSVTTTACARLNGSWGTASLLSSDQANFAQGRQAPLSGTGSGQTATWTNVSPGTYTVVVACSNGSTAGAQTVLVSGAPAAPAPRTASPTPSASPRGVLGGVGGATEDYGTVTLVAGGALAGTGVVAAAWFLRRSRPKPRRW
ncbi:hypothetical protein ACWD00_41115 [Streptomyces viridiviolaceus]